MALAVRSAEAGSGEVECNRERDGEPSDDQVHRFGAAVAYPVVVKIGSVRGGQGARVLRPSRDIYATGQLSRLSAR